jgi:hypothetical protein
MSLPCLKLNLLTKKRAMSLYVLKKFKKRKKEKKIEEAFVSH